MNDETTIFLALPIRDWLDLILEHREHRILELPRWGNLRQLIFLKDPEERYIHIEDDKWGKFYEVWRINDWRSCYERYKKVKAQEEADRYAFALWREAFEQGYFNMLKFLGRKEEPKAEISRKIFRSIVYKLLLGKDKVAVEKILGIDLASLPDIPTITDKMAAYLEFFDKKLGIRK